MLDCGRSWANCVGGSGVGVWGGHQGQRERQRESRAVGGYCAVCAVVSFLLSQIEPGSPLSLSLSVFLSVLTLQTPPPPLCSQTHRRARQGQR